MSIGDDLAQLSRTTSLLGATVVVAVLSSLLIYLSSAKMSASAARAWDGKNVFIGGASQGLGLAVAVQLAGYGAHVTIVSRSQSKLDVALVEVEKQRQSKEQRLLAIAADLSSPSGTEEAFNAYAIRNGGVAAPDYVFSCTGGAGNILGLFVDLVPEQLQQGFRTNYETVLWTSHSAAKRMVEQRRPGHIILTSSLVGLFSFAGYSAYSPAKHAIRGLADTLRNEFLLYNIKVHCYFPGTILSPGFVEEEKCKPAITKKIEGPDDGLTPEKCAIALINGVEQGNYFITSDPIGHLFRNAAKSASPSNNFITDSFWRILAAIGIPIWRRLSDNDVRAYAKKIGTVTG